jgi:hypothetical protein
LFERSELSEALAELSERSEKKKVNLLARWRVKRGRSKDERIELKMELRSNLGLRKIKRGRGGTREGENGRILMRSKSILLFLRARAGSLSKSLFFLD